MTPRGLTVRGALVVACELAACSGGGSGGRPRTFRAGEPATGAAHARAASALAQATIVGECAIGACPGGCCPPGTACNAVFSDAMLFPAGAAPGPLAFGDLDGNGKVDVVVGNSGGDISVLLGNGAGALGASTSYVVGGTVHEVAIADFDGDTKLDVAVAAEGDVRVLLGNGDGTLQTTAQVTASPSVAIVPALADAGATVDLFSVDYGVGVAVLAGNGDGTFTPGTAVSVADPATRVLAGDLDGDGAADAVLASSLGPIVLLGDGMGGLGAPARYAVTSGGAIGIGDLDRSGRPDLAQFGYTADNHAAVFVFRGDGDGTFMGPTPYPVEGGQQGGIAVADADGDGKVDVTVVDPTFGIPMVTVLAGHGDGALQRTSPYFVTGAGSLLEVAVLDLDGDARPDLVTSDPGSGTVAVLLGRAPAGCAASPVAPTCPASAADDCSDANFCAGTTGFGDVCCPSCASGTGCTTPECPAGFVLESEQSNGTRTVCCPEGLDAVPCNTDDPNSGCAYGGPVPPPTTPRGPCADGGWCPLGSSCAGAACCPDDHPVGCEASCCLPGASCDQGACGCPPGVLLCGSDCCDSGAQCVDGECVSSCTDAGFSTPCGDLCCADGVACLDGACACPEAYSTACVTPGECCLGGAPCIDATCGCPGDEAACGDRCCDTGEICEQGACGKPSVGGADAGVAGCPSPCGDGTAGCGYCLAGQIQCNGLCCSGKSSCADGNPCYVDPTCTHAGCPAGVGGLPTACGGDYTTMCPEGSGICCHKCLVCDPSRSDLCYNP
jgi:VCBS repeat protein